MADNDSVKPDWIPDWFPKGESLKYITSLLQVFVLVLGAAYLFFHLTKGRVKQVTATAAGAS